MPNYALRKLPHEVKEKKKTTHLFTSQPTMLYSLHPTDLSETAIYSKETGHKLVHIQ